MPNDKHPEAVEVAVEGGALPVDVYRPSSGEGAGLVLCQEIFGVTDFIADAARALAAQGYTVHVPHFYWRLSPPGEPAEVVGGGGETALSRGMELAQAVDWQFAVADAKAALEAAKAHPATGGRAGLFGYCWGGGLAFATAAVSEPDALVSYYGSALPMLLDLAPAVTVPSVHHFGTADAFIPLEAQARIRAAVERDGVEWHEWEGAGHAFSNPLPEYHHEVADRGAWEVTTSWLAENFPAR